MDDEFVDALFKSFFPVTVPQVNPQALEQASVLSAPHTNDGTTASQYQNARVNPPAREEADEGAMLESFFSAITRIDHEQPATSAAEPKSSARPAARAPRPPRAPKKSTIILDDISSPRPPASSNRDSGAVTTANTARLTDHPPVLTDDRMEQETPDRNTNNNDMYMNAVTADTEPDADAVEAPGIGAGDNADSVRQLDTAGDGIYMLLADLDAFVAGEAQEQRMWDDIHDAVNRVRACLEVVRRLEERIVGHPENLPFSQPLGHLRGLLNTIADTTAELRAKNITRTQNTERLVRRATAVSMGLSAARPEDALDAMDTYLLRFDNNALLPYDTTETLNLSEFDIGQ